MFQKRKILLISKSSQNNTNIVFQSLGEAPQSFSIKFCFGFDISKSNYDHRVTIFWMSNNELVVACWHACMLYMYAMYVCYVCMLCMHIYVCMLCMLSMYAVHQIFDFHFENDTFCTFRNRPRPLLEPIFRNFFAAPGPIQNSFQNKLLQNPSNIEKVRPKSSQIT